MADPETGEPRPACPPAACSGQGACAGADAGEAPAAPLGAAGAQPVDCYVLFDSHTAALSLFQALKDAGVGARISPTPRLARTTCGVSLLTACDDRARIEALAREGGVAVQDIVALPRQIDPARDRYC